MRPVTRRACAKEDSLAGERRRGGDLGAGRRGSTRLLATAAAAIVLAAAGGAYAGGAATSQQPESVPGELVVGFHPRASQSAQNAALAEVGAARTRSFSQIGVALVRTSGNAAAASEALRGNPNVRYVQPNFVYRLQATPDDPSFGELWGLHNTGQGGGTPDADIDAPEAWDLETGDPAVVVAVVDTGVDFGHPDLAARRWVNTGENCGSSDPTATCDQRTNGVDDDGNGYVDDWRGWDFVNGDNDPLDDHSHGTHVAGTIGAVGNNGVGVVGVAWDVRIMALKFLNASGNGTTAGAIAATLYAADEGALVSNNSWGGGEFDQALLDAIEYGASRGMLFVAAAGNNGRDNESTPTYPASYGSDAIVGVAATDRNDARASFSNYGRTSVDLGAPGVSILSTAPGGGYLTLSGTSMATPHVSGAAALVFAGMPDATPYGVKALLLRSVDPNAALADRTTTGGRLNAATALACSDAPKVWVSAPAEGFSADVGEPLPIGIIGTSCAAPAGVANVSATVDGSPVLLTASATDSGLYRGTYTPAAAGLVTVQATVTVGSSTASQTVTGSVASPPADLFALDAFNRPNETLSDGGRWSNGVNGSGEAGLQVSSNQLACSKSTTCTAWRNDASYGPDAEVWAKVTTLPGSGNAVRLYVRLQTPGSSASDGYMLRTTQLSGTDQVYLERITNGAVTTLLTINQELVAGDILLLRAEGSRLEAWRQAGSSWTRLGWVSSSSYLSAGYAGVGLRGTSGRLDDFGARTMGSPPPPPPPPPEPPGAPSNLTAQPSDGSVSLSWQAPASDGGSAITSYRLYRGTSSGTTVFLASVTGTSHVDSTVSNGTTYFYEVAAVNEAGEGPRSNEASATPTGASPPADLFALDDFNRPNETLSDAGRWSNGVASSGESGLQVSSNQLACPKSTTCTAWRNDATYGPDAEAWATITTLPGNGNAVRLYVRLQSPGSSAADGYFLLFNQLSGTDQLVFYRMTNASLTVLKTLTREIAAGDALLLRATGSTLEAWHRSGTTWTRPGEVTDATYLAAGYAGVGIRGTSGRADDFGARTMGSAPPPPPPPPELPGAPGNLAALAGDGSVSLSWQAPASDGGSTITSYKVYGGTSADDKTLLASVTGTSYVDSGLVNGTTYFYEVAAVNAVGEGPRSNEASATPAGVVPPADLFALDDFDRPDEKLSDGGRWSNGVARSGESGLQVSSNRLACTKVATCTAWRNDATYGPDAEAWATITTLPGNGNAVRLYVRLQTPGSSAVDGYMLRTNQLSGTDQVFLERLTNGAVTTLLTINQELAVGDTLLLRAQGPTLEAWRLAGGSWTRLGWVSSSSYLSAGYSGVGLRGKSGRLDDFGTRTLP